MRRVWAALLSPLAACVDAEPVSAPGEPPPPVVGALAPPAGQLVLPTGYAAEPVTSQLVDPRAVVFDEAGMAYVLEGEPARLSRLTAGTLVPVANGGGNGPWTGVAWLGRMFYVAEAGGPLGGRVLRVEPDGGLVPVAENLPAGGVLGPLAAGPDNHLYLGVATAAAGGGPGARDVPCQDVRLQGGGRVEGAVPCTGSVLRIDPDGGPPEVHAWGFTRPVGLDFTPDGRLLVADDLPPAGDVLWAAVPGVWYGWPDYLGQVATADPHLEVHPNPPPAPVATLDGDVAAVAVAESPAFGGPAQAFVAMEGGQVAFSTLDSGVTVPFAANLRRPSAVAFDPGDGALWVADAGTGVLWRVVAFPPSPPG